MKNVKLHPEVYTELESSRSWYEEKCENLGNDFLVEVDNAMRAIQETPETWPYYDKELGLRSFLLHRFPFAVIYRQMGVSIHVIAVMHLRRKPGYWNRRLSQEM